MNRRQVLLAVAGALVSAFTACGGGSTSGNVTTPPTSFHESFPDSSGTIETFSQQQIDKSGPFFAKLGSNDRSCASCHDAADGWSITPAHLQQLFQATQGTDPVFRASDGANCPSDDVSTESARTSAYSLLLNHGLIRMSLPVPANADFSIVSINDPYHCPETTATQLALYRRPLPATNLKFLNGIMWDGRESDLQTQAKHAVQAHTQPTNMPTDAQLQQIVSLESSLFTAQSVDNLAGDLTAGANGGPLFLATQAYSPGINSGALFNPNAFTLYTGWANASGNHASMQQSIARGEVLFNTFPMVISAVPGFNDVLGQTIVVGTCTTCHNTPNVGSSSSGVMVNIGAGEAVGDLPLYELQCDDGSQALAADPGQALVTGKCADVGKFKVPGVRGLAARAPYFHNGAADTLTDVVNFYVQRFNMTLSEEQKADLVAFMSAL